jgi:uncharacterized membrane protein YfcA
MFLLAFVVGIIGGTYGIGGGAIIAPFCVAVFHLPVYTVAGAALLATFLTSVVGIFFYSVLPANGGVSTSPDWVLGFSLGSADSRASTSVHDSRNTSLRNASSLCSAS